MSDNTEQSIKSSAQPQPVEAKPVEVAVQQQNDVICIRAHSPIIYWWPVWLLAGFFWVCHVFLLPENEPSSAMGLAFVATLIFVIFSTTVRLRGANSIIFLLVVVILGILIVMANLTDFLAGVVGSLDITMSSGFYLALFLSVFGLWSLMFFVFDRIRYWEVVPGQVKEHMIWGGRESVLGSSGAKCHYKSDDFLRHRVLGCFLMGDLEIVNGDERVDIPNVFFARRKTRKINDLIVMRPVV